VSLFLFFACPIPGINRNWEGTCHTTLSGDFNEDYYGIVESFIFEENGTCTLEILDDFQGESTRKYYEGIYDYDKQDHFLSYSLTLKRIDSFPVAPENEYLLSGSDTFDLEDESGNIRNGKISGGDLPSPPPPPPIEIEIDFSLEAE
jgi:hypothetical protein